MMEVEMLYEGAYLIETVVMVAQVLLLAPMPSDESLEQGRNHRCMQDNTSAMVGERRTCLSDIPCREYIFPAGWWPYADIYS